jgi:cell wall-associated protease
MKINAMNFLVKIFCISLFAYGIAISPIRSQEKMESWHHQSGNSEFPTGIGSAEWYSNSKSNTSRKIVVAILDSGVDIEHPDLKDNIWVNPGEIAGNKKDDDGNGYVDDIHGWTFIGGPDGRSVVKESFEVTRVYARDRAKWENVDPTKLKGKKKREYEKYLEVKEIVETKLENAKNQIAEVEEMQAIVLSALHAAKAELKGDSLNVELLEKSENEEVLTAAKIIRNVQEQGIPVESIDWLIEVAVEQFAEQKKANEDIINYSYNPDYNSRLIVGDTYSDFTNRNYGNNDVDGEFAYHGTHVAGIVGAVRNNGIGVDGIADNVALMSLRIVPDGDERDKDVANAIIYAVDNGAEVINMSFGKGYSPEKKLVDNAMKYAAKKDVLLVLGAGNEGADLDKSPKFPNDTYLNSKKGPKNLISVGALAPDGGMSAVAEFSNYGKKEVDVFAPGVYVYSTTPDSTYDYASGTSMASPVVAGVATVLRSRYPNLSAAQIKDILIKSARDLPNKVIQPGTFEEVSSSELGIAGAVDLPAAMQLASKTKGKRKSTQIPTEYVKPGANQRT